MAEVKESLFSASERAEIVKELNKDKGNPFYPPP
jgi:hypothetical protein